MNARMAEIAAALADLRVRADALLAETAEGGGALAELPAGLEAYERQANKVADMAAIVSAQALRMIVDADAPYAAPGLQPDAPAAPIGRGTDQASVDSRERIPMVPLVFLSSAVYTSHKRDV